MINCSVMLTLLVILFAVFIAKTAIVTTLQSYYFQKAVTTGKYNWVVQRYPCEYIEFKIHWDRSK